MATRKCLTFVPGMKHLYGTFSAEIWVSLKFRETSHNIKWRCYFLPMGKTIKGYFFTSLPKVNFCHLWSDLDCARFDIWFYSLAKIHWLICAVCLWLLNKTPSQMFLIGLRTITFLFYLIKEKKRNTLAILLKAIGSFKVIIPFSEYEVINRNSKRHACNSRHVEI